MKDKEVGFADRLNTAAKARQALLEKAKAQAPENDPGFAERQAAREANAAARALREAERQEARRAEQARVAAAKAAEAAAQAAAAEAARQAQEAEKAERKARQLLREAEQKVNRDKRYAARKARQR